MYNLKSAFKSILSFIYFYFKLKNKFGVIENDKYSNLFFGYYDVSSFDKSEKLLGLHGQKNEEELDILVYDIKIKSFKIIDSTKAWNYQQGARLMWFGDDELIYNKFDFELKKYYSLVKNIENGNENRIPYPLQTLFKKDYMLSISYYHLTKMGTEYGYKHEEKANDSDSLIYVDLKNDNKATILFKIKDCFDILRGIYSNADKLHFNHFLISPDGSYFIFIFRFHVKAERKDHLLGYSFKDKKLELLIEDELISHCSWRNQNEFIFWGKINQVPGYYLFSFNNEIPILKLNIVQDGHPTFIDNDTFITDTYPNHFLCQNLSVVNLETGISKLILKRKHPAFYTAYERCDLHPSLSLSKTKFQIDIINKKKRTVCIGNL